MVLTVYSYKVPREPHLKMSGTVESADPGRRAGHEGVVLLWARPVSDQVSEHPV